jgi:hypothetical protein
MAEPTGTAIRSVLAGIIRQEECDGCPGIVLQPALEQQSAGDIGCKSCDQQAKLLENNNSTERTAVNP